MKKNLSQNKSEYKRKIPNRMLGLCIPLILITTIFSVGVTLSKMTSTADGNTNTQVAAYIIEAKGDTQSSLKIDCYEGNKTASYSFLVTNTKDGKISEVSVKYDIIITLPQIMPQGVTMHLNGRTASVSEDGKIYTFENVGILEAGKKKNDSYTLTFTADSNLVEGDFQLKGIKIDVHTEQID